ncbi:MAG: DUF1189 family protein [Clostridiales bacterium]
MFFLKTYIYSIFNTKYYLELNKKSMKIAIFYFIILLVFFSAISSVKVFLNFDNKYNDVKKEFNEKIDEFEIKDGLLTIKGENPLIIRREYLNVFFYDSKNEISFDKKDSIINLIFTKKEFIFEDHLSKIREFRVPYKKMFLQNINKEDFLMFLDIYFLITIILLVLFFVVLDILNIFFMTIIITWIARIINLINGIDSNFKSVYKITLYALTLPITINIILVVIDFNLVYFNLVFIMICLFYLLFAFNNIGNSMIKKESHL